LSLAPIVLFVYNRPWHTSQTLEALTKNELANQSQLFIFADGPKKDAGVDELRKIEEVKKIIYSKKWCGNVTIANSAINKGLANSIVEGITKIVNQYGKVIILEDDIVTSEGFLKFMNDGLNFYEKEESVMDISGYSFPVKTLELPNIFFLQMASCWGWATWSRAWRYFTPDTKWLYDELLKENKWKSFLYIGQENYKIQLMNNLNGKIHTWAIKWQAVMTLRNGLSLQPGKSLVKNIGFDSSGTNYNEKDATFNIDKLHNNIKMERIPSDKIKEDKDIAKIYSPFYLGTIEKTSQNGKSRMSILHKIADRFKSIFID
jgi:hypothetical protein